ncbi:DNA adenine methylase [Ralstonia solanacearum]|uniref:DNA adenine methylase n=1 Tax=Ralstonia solanacearum TaxID=305 RepID=UPI000F6152ED|nr:DNA adenine methylase [Ralstonia solanacearum]
MSKSNHFSGYFASPLRYPGGKGRLGPWLASVISGSGLNGGLYVEPYAGGAGAALYLLRENHVDSIVINDADPVIYAFWRSVVEDTSDFVDMIRTTPVTLKERARLQEVVTKPDQHAELELGFAAFFLNRTSRSGILAGGVIGGKEQTGEYKLDARYKKDDLVARVQAIGALRSRITVIGMDALDLLSCHTFPDQTLFYLDPPYYVKGSQLYRNHYHHSDHEAIAQYAQRATQPLLITYDDCPEIRDLYHGMNSSNFSLQYSTHMARPMSTEVLFYKNLELPTAPQLTRGSKLSTGRRTSRAAPAQAAANLAGI